MSRGEWKAAQHGPDWYDVFRLQRDLLYSQECPTLIAFEASGDAKDPRLLCIVTAVSCGADGLPRAGTGTSFPMEDQPMRTLPGRIHEALSNLYDLLAAVEDSPH